MPQKVTKFRFFRVWTLRRSAGKQSPKLKRAPRNLNTSSFEANRMNLMIGLASSEVYHLAGQEGRLPALRGSNDVLNSCLADRSKRIGPRLDLDLHSVSFFPLSGTSSRVMQRSIALTSLLVLRVSQAAAAQVLKKPLLVFNCERSHLCR